MSEKFIRLTPELHRYVLQHGARQDDVLSRLADETSALGGVAVMQVAPDEGALLTLLVRLTGARRALEIGTFTGYSAISIARGLGDDGRLLCCDVSEEWTNVARRYFREAGVEHKIDLQIAPALDTLRALADGISFDFAFIDADKESYALYYEEVVRRLRPGGLIAIDNVLWGGKVADPEDRSETTETIRALNDRIVQDERVDVALLTIADGLTLVCKR
jgi:predicted O-methyltransferase YrrM